MAPVVSRAGSPPRTAAASRGPDKAAIAAFAAQLGIEADEEEEFLWIAEVGLQTSLPPRWKSELDVATGLAYYFDNDLQDSSWLNPLVPYLKQVVEVGRMYLLDPTVNFFEEQTRSLWHEHKQELDCWHGPFSDSEGNNYFVNSRDGISSWQDPRIGAQYIFELQSGLLSHLQKVLASSEQSTFVFDAIGQKREGGAEVLTLEPGSAGLGTHAPPSRGRQSKFSPSRSRNRMDLHSAEDRALVLKEMGSAAERLHEALEDDQEAQRLQLTRKVEERRQRTLFGKL